VVAAALRRCRGCGCELPLVPIPRYEVCESCGWEPAAVEHPPKSGHWTPDSPQRLFLSETVFECGYGGQAGGGKSEGLLALPFRYVNHPEAESYRCLILRRTFPELERSLIPRALRMYNGKGSFVSSPTPRFTFRTGAVVEFGHLQHESDLDKYQSAEYQTIGMDEGAHFTEYMYTYMLSRLRSSRGIPSRMRVTFNPPRTLDGVWVVRRFAPWIDFSPDYHGPRAASGQRLYYVNSRQHGERYVPKGTIDEEGNPAQGRVFIRSTIADNPYLDRNDPQYRSRLLALDPITRAQLLDGDFSRIDRPGAVWQRALIDAGRRSSHPVLHRIGIGLDPSGSHRKGSDEAGIIPAGVGPCFCSGERENHAFVFDDLSGVLPATSQARRSIAAYHDLRADFVVAEINYGGEWIKATINEIDPTVNVDVVHVTKGKAVRAEPVAALYGKLEDDGTVTGCKVHHVGTLAGLENEMCTLDPREPPKVSPGRLDALVFVLSKLLLGAPAGVEGVHSEGKRLWNPRDGFMT
jgi:hypothetical protein